MSDATVRVTLRRPGPVYAYPDNATAEAWLRVFSSRTPGRQLRAFSLPMLASMRHELGVAIIVDATRLRPDHAAAVAASGLLAGIEGAPQSS